MRLRHMRCMQMTRARFGGWLSDVGQFDAGLFNISAPEAELMDPPTEAASGDCLGGATGSCADHNKSLAVT